jgi:hypothetical protein
MTYGNRKIERETISPPPPHKAQTKVPETCKRKALRTHARHPALRTHARHPTE